MATYKTRIYGDEIEISANFSWASDQIMGDLAGGRQVADFRHSPQAAMREALRQYIVACGDDPDDEEYDNVIEDAVSEMTEEEG